MVEIGQNDFLVRNLSIHFTLQPRFLYKLTFMLRYSMDILNMIGKVCTNFNLILNSQHYLLIKRFASAVFWVCQAFNHVNLKLCSTYPKNTQELRLTANEIICTRSSVRSCHLPWTSASVSLSSFLSPVFGASTRSRPAFLISSSSSVRDCFWLYRDSIFSFKTIEVQ